MKSRTVLITLVSISLVPVALVGGCMLLAVGAGVASYRDDAADRAKAAADPQLQRPLVSTAGRIVFVAQDDATNDFYVAKVDGSGTTRLTHFPHGSLPTTANVSPDGSRIAINDNGVSIIATDRPAVLSHFTRPEGWLAWSPDGTRLASLSLDDQARFHLYLFSADGSGDARDIAAGWPTPAPGDRRSVGDLTWSPDGKRFAFVYNTAPAYKRSGPRHNHLYIALSDGSWIKNVSLDAGSSALPVLGGLRWSPDGKYLGFESGQGIATIDADLKWRAIAVAIHGTRSSQLPSWSPDGTRLLWFNPDSIVVSAPFGEEQKELSRGRCRGVQPSWSPDGLRIAFACHEGRGDIFVMNADGSGLTSVADIGENKAFRFSGGFLPHSPVWVP